MLNILSGIFIKRVRDDYDAIAEDFSNTRQEPWEGFNLIKRYFKKDKTVLDIGCGNGRLSDFFTFKSYTGIDISKNLIEIAKNKFDKKNVSFEVGNFTSLPSSAKYDVVVGVAAFHHLPSNKMRKKALNEVKKVLKKDGVFIFSVWNLLHNKKYESARRRALLRCILTFGLFHPRDLFIPWKKGGEKRKRYYYAFKEKEVVTLLHKSGFVTIDAVPESNGKRVALEDSHNIYFVCRKK